MNTVSKLWASILGMLALAASTLVSQAQDPAYVTEVETAATTLKTNVEGMLPELFALAVVLIALSQRVDCIDSVRSLREYG